MARRAVFLALDNSRSMTPLRLEAVRFAVGDLLDRFQTFIEIEGNYLDLGICVWSGSAAATSYYEFRDADSASLGYARAVLDTNDGGGDGTNFATFAPHAVTFFEGTLGVEFEDRTCIVITDGEPNFTSDTDNAVNIMSDLLDKTSGQFKELTRTEVNCYGINIDLGNTAQTARIDNTPDDGVPSISVANAFDVSGYLRAILFPLKQSEVWGFPTVWQEGFQEELSFRTEIIVSRSGLEQRIAQREKPRMVYGFNSMVVGENFRQALRRQSQNQAREFVIAHPRDSALVVQDALFGETLVYVESVPSWAKPGREAIIESRDGKTFGTFVSRTGVGTISFTKPLTFDFPRGSRVRRGVYGVFQSATRINAYTNRVGVAEVEFAGDPIRTAHPVFSETPPFTYKTRELFILAPNWSKQITLDFEQYREDLDLGKGAFDAIYPVDFTVRGAKLTFNLKRQSEIDAMRGLIYRCRGRQKSFFMPSWLDEIIPLAGVNQNATTITVAGREYFDQYQETRIYRHVIIKLRDQTYIKARVELIELDALENSRLTLDHVFEADTPLENIVFMTWLLPVRLESDRTNFEWLTDGVAEVTLSVMTVEPHV